MSGAEGERTARVRKSPAAEPGPAGPSPATEEELDVLPDADAVASGTAGTDDRDPTDGPVPATKSATGDTAFRSPTPGDRLTLGQLDDQTTD